MLEGYTVELQGTLIYHDGSTLMELTTGKRALLKILENTPPGADSFLPESHGALSLTGEIIDAKCYFGVMKPGYAKPHRSCASLCIAQGIPPVFRTINAQGHNQYYLLMGAGYQPLTTELKPYIAEAVTLKGRHSERNGWDFIELAPADPIQRIYP